MAACITAGLSRSEFRICTLVGQGMAPKAIAQQLALRETTVRTHLSAIYSKTATARIVDLFDRLLAAKHRGFRGVDTPHDSQTPLVVLGPRVIHLG